MYERICFTSSAWHRDALFTTVWWQMRGWGGILAVILFAIILIMMYTRKPVCLRESFF